MKAASNPDQQDRAERWSDAPDQAVTTIIAHEAYRLASGENPYQTPATLLATDAEDDLALHRFGLFSEEAPCFVNLADLDCILETLCKLTAAFARRFRKAPLVAIAAKHGNACGVGVDWECRAACIEAALWGNPMAVWGGEVIVNFTIEEPEARLLFESDRRAVTQGSSRWMLDVIAAPAFGKEARAVLLQRKRTKLLANPALVSPRLSPDRWSHRPVRGGLLRQPPADYILDFEQVDWVAGDPLGDQIESLIIAWAAAYTCNLGGNEVALAKNNRLLAVGGGPSTVDAAESVVGRARKFHDPIGAVFAADAFFPFTDAPRILADAGCAAGLVPEGGIRRNDVRAFFAERRIRAGFLPEPYRGFCRH